MSYLETKNLLQDTISTPIQSHVSQIKYPCTGFCYMAVQKRDHLLALYQQKSSTYSDEIKDLILQACERKKNNPNIDQQGEYINQPTVYEDFDIAHFMQFSEMGIATDEDLEIVINNICIMLLDVQIGNFAIVNRSMETFLMMKIEDDKFLIIDSHQPIHGVVDLSGVCKYITRHDKVKGNIQIGIFTS